MQSELPVAGRPSVERVASVWVALAKLPAMTCGIFETFVSSFFCFGSFDLNLGKGSCNLSFEVSCMVELCLADGV